jgi:hypothetical protein
LDAVPSAILTNDVYEIFNVKRGFMIMNAGFIVSDDYEGTEPGNILALGDHDDLIVKDVGGVLTSDEDFFAIGDLYFGKLYYPGLQGVAGGFGASGLNGYMAVGDTSIDLSIVEQAETDGALLEELKLQLFMFGFHAMDGDISGFEEDLVPGIIP